MADKVFLLGAGASKDAGLPLASEITGIAVDQMNHDGVYGARGLAGALNFVVSAMLAHAGRSGGRPDRMPDIESVVSAIDLLSSRSSLELTPFVQSWDPGVSSAVRVRNESSRTALTKMRDALSSRNDTMGEGPFREAFALMLDQRLGKNADSTYARLNAELVRLLVPTLTIADPATLGYLNPLIELGRIEDGVTLATLNYDLSIETAAELAAVQLSTGVEDWGASGAVSWATTGVRLLKLHGSIGWTATSSEPPRALQLNPEQFDPRPPDLSRREPPAVIYGKRGKLRGDGPYLELRAAFARELREVDCLVTIGYSFADDHVNALIRRWVNSDESRWIVSVDPSPAIPPFGFDPTFAGELTRLIPRAHDFARIPDKRPQFYRLEQTAAEAIPRVCLPAEDLRATFSAWEQQLQSTL